MDRHLPILTRWTAAVPAAFLAVFFIWPVANILWLGLFGTEGTSVIDVLGNTRIWRVAWFTLWQAAVSTALTMAVALPGAYLFARYRFKGRSLIRAALTVPFVLPTVVVGSAFSALLSPGGLLGVDLLRTVWAILLAHAFFNYAVVVRTVSTFWAQLDPDLRAAARVLGASPWQVWKRVTYPLLRPALAAAASIVFLFSFTSFGVILILGGLEHTTIEVEIWRQTTQFLNLPLAAVLTLLQMAAVVGALVWYSSYQRRTTTKQQLSAGGGVRPQGRQWFAVAANLSFMAFFLGLPIGVLFERSFRTGTGFGLDAYRSLLDGSSLLGIAPIEAIRNSLGFALAATLIAVVIGGLAAATVTYGSGRMSRWFDVLLMLPLGTSAVTVGFGFLIALDSPVDLRTSRLLVPLAHALVAVPFVVRVSVPVMASMRDRLREAAATLGASPLQVWRRLDLPVIRRALAVAAGFAFAISLGEFGATAFIARPDTQTMPTVIFRLLQQPGATTFGQAMAMATVLMAATTVAVLAIDRWRTGGEF